VLLATAVFWQIGGASSVKAVAEQATSLGCGRATVIKAQVLVGVPHTARINTSYEAPGVRPVNEVGLVAGLIKVPPPVNGSKVPASPQRIRKLVEGGVLLSPQETSNEVPVTLDEVILIG